MVIPPLAMPGDLQVAEDVPVSGSNSRGERGIEGVRANLCWQADEDVRDWEKSNGNKTDNTTMDFPNPFQAVFQYRRRE